MRIYFKLTVVLSTILCFATFAGAESLTYSSPLTATGVNAAGVNTSLPSEIRSFDTSTTAVGSIPSSSVILTAAGGNGNGNNGCGLGNGGSNGGNNGNGCSNGGNGGNGAGGNGNGAGGNGNGNNGCGLGNGGSNGGNNGNGCGGNGGGGVTATPEPGTMILLGTGLTGLFGIARRKMKKS